MFELVNKMNDQERKNALYLCCSSAKWAEKASLLFPIENIDEFFKKSDEIWFKLDKKDWLEAFSHHPRIGGNIDALREKFKATKNWSSQEQSGVSSASDDTLLALSSGNEEYERKFGHVFLICATGKSADEMLAALNERLGNSAETELKNACIEQSKITRIRFLKLLEKK